MCGIAGQYQLKTGQLDPLCDLQSCLPHPTSRTGQRRLSAAQHHIRRVLNCATGRIRRKASTTRPSTRPSSFAPDLVLGQRRLSILDLSPKGHEPMALAGRDDLWITFNGELYNYLEVRAELQAKGRVFTTECDVEVLLHAYDEWGVACLDRFLGMFAFALWDQKRQRLWCARDRFGIKPFYYAVSENRFSFASEMKALRILAP